MLPSSGQRSTVRLQQDCSGIVLLSKHPLKNAGVLSTSRDKMTVVMEEGNVGHMAAMPTIDMAGSLRIKKKIYVFRG